MACAEIDALFDIFSIDQQRRVFAGVVGAGEGRVVAVVGGDDEEVVCRASRREFRAGACRNVLRLWRSLRCRGGVRRAYRNLRDSRKSSLLNRRLER